ncbi:MAG: GyrI-like domain-containing protein [Mycoplasma sp.]
MKKYEWRVLDKNLYLPKQKPYHLNIPKMKYFTIEGQGNPNNENFSKNIEALYSMSYAIRMLNKAKDTPSDYYEYTVFPLEGLWDLTEEGKKLDCLNKDELVYKLMIRQPDFLNDKLFDDIRSKVFNKKQNPLILSVNFEEIEEGNCVQMMHIGSYDDEPKTFKMMNEFIESKNLSKTDLRHKEIYISDFRKTPPEKLKTVLRYYVK